MNFWYILIYLWWARELLRERNTNSRSETCTCTTTGIRWVRCDALSSIYLFVLQAVGRRDHRSCRYSSGSGTEPQCCAECTNEEDTFWSVQDVEPSDLPVKSWTCTVITLVFVDVLVRIRATNTEKKKKKKNHWSRLTTTLDPCDWMVMVCCCCGTFPLISCALTVTIPVWMQTVSFLSLMDLVFLFNIVNVES